MWGKLKCKLYICMYAYLVFTHNFWLTAPWNFRSVESEKGVFVMLEVSFGNYLRMGAGCQGSQLHD